MKEIKQYGIYIHIPFCKSKCNYCDFLSFKNRNEYIEQYIGALIKEILYFFTEAQEKIKVKTVYIGGGTPSYIDSKYIVKILDTIKENAEMQNSEITIEINPGTVDKSKLQDYINSGINRISIGLQSCNDEILKNIGRKHTYEEFLESYNLVKQVGFTNINVDLMLGLPNQTIEILNKDLKKIINLNPEHISLYSLILEENNKINESQLPNEDIERKMYWETKTILEQNGYNHYEISNFSKESYESKHNLDCWKQREYIGFGLGAHSYTDNIRYSNIEILDEYISNINKNIPEDNIIIYEKQDETSKMSEYILLSLRTIKGCNISNISIEFDKKINKLIKLNLLEKKDEYIKLTNKGIDFANIVWQEFV